MTKNRSLKALLLLFAAAFLLYGCASHYQSGMKAYRGQNYQKAVDELSMVPKTDPNYTEALSTLAKAEYQLTLNALHFSKTPSEAAENISKLVPLAIKLKSKEAADQALAAVLEKLKEAKDPAVIKAALVGLRDLIREQNGTEKTKELLLVLAGKAKEFLFNGEIRSQITGLIDEIR